MKFDIKKTRKEKEESLIDVFIHCGRTGDLSLARVIYKTNWINIDVQDEDGTTILMTASQGRLSFSLDLINWILSKNPDVNICRDGGWYGDTALYIAATYAPYEVVEKLIKRGADPHLSFKDNYRSPYVEAKHSHSDKYAKLLKLYDSVVRARRKKRTVKIRKEFNYQLNTERR